MPNREMDDPEEKPLDPEMEKVRRKMVRLLAVSVGIMMIGLMAVLGAIVYRATEAEPGQGGVASGSGPGFAVDADEIHRAQATLPADFIVDSVALDGSVILFYGRTGDGGSRAFLFDVAAGRIVADVIVSK